MCVCVCMIVGVSGALRHSVQAPGFLQSKSADVRLRGHFAIQPRAVAAEQTGLH